MKQPIPTQLRAEFLNGSKDFLNEFIQIAKGEKDKFTSSNNFAITNTWDLLKDIIKQADDPIPIAWTDPSTRGRVDTVLNQVSNGVITPDEGKRLLALVSMGFEMTDLQEIIAKMDSINPA